MTLGEWLATRTPPPPPALAERVREALAGDLASDASEAPERCLGAATRLLSSLLHRPDCGSRRSAVDLLAADALVTYAFEAASVEPGLLPDRTEHAMRWIAGHVAPSCS